VQAGAQEDKPRAQPQQQQQQQQQDLTMKQQSTGSWVLDQS
jgi:hypothetical protein